MREIKFRAWVSNPEQEEHGYYTDEVLYDQGEWYIEGDGQWTYDELEKEGVYIEQFTGIQDSEGVDIYEGDVCRYGITCFTVVFKNGAFGYMFFGDFHWLVNFNKADLKVIGNIHQHAHLLEE